MGNRNLTLAFDEDLLAEARVLAARRRTSVNRLVREHLEELVAGEQAEARRLRMEGLAGIRRFLAEPLIASGGDLPTRDELHER